MLSPLHERRRDSIGRASLARFHQGMPQGRPRAGDQGLDTRLPGKNLLGRRDFLLARGYGNSPPYKQRARHEMPYVPSRLKAATRKMNGRSIASSMWVTERPVCRC
jgi:hypothetical protein